MDELSKIDIASLPGTSALTIRRLKSLGIKNYWDLFNYFPFRYENYSLIAEIRSLQEGETVTVKGIVLDFKNEYTKRGKNIQKAILYDQTGKIDLIWYNQSYLARIIKNGIYLSVAGEVKKFGFANILEVKEYDIIPDLKARTIHTGRLVPIYSEKRNLSSKTLREKINYLLQSNLEKIKEILPKEIIEFNKLLPEKTAYQNIHFPENNIMAEKARNRLAFDEIFIINLSSQLIKKLWQKEKVSCPLNLTKENISDFNEFINNLPFKLTNAQNKVLYEIVNDLKRNQPMNRLLQGDVGSGKTVIATIAAYISFLNGYKTLLMAPTEILAQQHFYSFRSLFSNPKIKKNPKIILLTSSKKPKHDELLDSDIIIGTHALIQKKIAFDKVALVIIDEQHKFGVVQRAELKNKAAKSHKTNFNPHLLTMTATPIPRTVALTLYGELDLSVIDELPPGRRPVKTFIVPQHKRQSAYQWIKNQIRISKNQVFIICPLIEESNVETLKSVKAVKEEFELLKNVFREFKLGLLHGKMKNKEKEEVMSDFLKNKTQILVATPVVEVGVDVPNANIIVIEGAERFGLAQLHQLRGRVGRSDKQSYCLLFVSKNQKTISDRLRIFSKINNGFKLAEYDLKIRGSGEIYGTRQHGIINLKIASLADFSLINKVRLAVNYFINNYSIDNFLPLKKRIENYRISLITQD